MTEVEESLHFLDYWRIMQSRREIVIAVSLLIIVTGVLVTFSMPKVYKASAVIQVKEEAPDVPFTSRDMVRYDPLFLRTQYEIIQSRPILEEVIQQLNLNEKLGKAYNYLDESELAIAEHTLKILSRAMKVRQYRDTNLIAIEIYMSEPKETAPQEAAEIANRIADIYREQNAERSRKATDRAMESLQTSLKEKNKEVMEKQARVEEIRKKYGITVLASTGGSEGEGAMALQKTTMAKTDSEFVKLGGELDAKKAIYDTIKRLSDKDLLNAGPRLVSDPALLALVQDKRKAEVELGSLLSKDGLGENHPDVLRTKATVKELDDKIKDALRGLRMGIQADYETAKARYDFMEKRMEAMKAGDIENEAGGYQVFQQAIEDLQQSKKIRDALELRYHEEKIELRIPRTTVEKIEPAKPPERNNPASPRFLLNIILSIIAGLTCGVGVAYFIEYLDTSVKTIEEVERFMHLPVLGVIPQKIKPFADDPSQGSHIEAYRVLRTNIRFSKKHADIRTLCVTSGSVGEGKSLTLANLAYVCAQLGDRVLLVDSDLHRPRQHKILGLSNSPGLANVLIGEASIEDAIVHTRVPNLDFLPSGKLSSSVHGLLDTEKMGELIALFRENYNFVLLDAPPIVGVSDASLLVGKVDGVLLIVQHRKYPRSVSNRAKDMVQNIGANLLGVVLNNINILRDYSYYYQYYSYSQLQGQNKGAGRTA